MLRTEATTNERLAWGAAVVLVTLLAFGLRVRGIGALVPYHSDSDGHVVTQAMLMQGDFPHPSRNRNWGKYPHLTARLASLFPLSPASPPVSLDDHLHAAAQPFVVTRYVVAAVSVLIVPATFLLSRIFLSAAWALLAAAFSATSLLHMNFAQQARPHAVAAGLIVLAVVAAVRLRRDPRLGNYALAGLAAACAIGSLQFGLAVLPPLGLAILLAERRRASGTLVGLGVVALVLALSVPLFHDYVLSDSAPERTAMVDMHADNWTLRTAGHVVYLNSFRGEGFETLFRTYWFLEPTMLALGSLGMIACALSMRRRGREPRPPGFGRDVIVVLSHAVPFFLLVSLYNRTFERFTLPLIPYAACLSAAGLRLVVGALARPMQRAGSGAVRLLSVSLCVAFLALPTSAVWHLGSARAQADTFELAAAWLQARPEFRDARIALPRHIDLPLFRSSASVKSLDYKDAWVRYQAKRRKRAGEDTYSLLWMDPKATLEHPAAVLRSLRADYAVIMVVPQTLLTGLFSPLRKHLRKSAELLVRFSPYPPESTQDQPVLYTPAIDRVRLDEWDQGMTMRMFEVERAGCVLEIYKL